MPSGLQTVCSSARRAHRTARLGFGLITAVLLGLLLFSSSVAAHEALHGLLHADAESEDHSCFASLLLKQQVLAEEPKASLPLPPSGKPCLGWDHASFVWVESDVQLGPSRAPPCHSVSL